MKEWQFRNLVFEGGGVLGIAYAGALRVAEDQGIMTGIKRVAGASAGAITASLLAMGYDAKGIQQVVGATNFSSFMDAPGGVFPSLGRALRRFGWFAGDAFSDWMRERVAQQGFRAELTFAELAALAEAQPSRYRQLYVVASDLTRGLVVQFDAESTPDVQVWKAVRASMSIPFFFASVTDSIKAALRPDIPVESAPGEGVLLVDGGVTWNYPIDIFDDRRFMDEESDAACFVDPRSVGLKSVYDSGHMYNKQTLGFRVDSKDEVAEYKNRAAAPPLEIKNVLGYSLALIQFMRGIANRSHLNSLDWHRTIFLDDGGIPFTDFNLPERAIDLLVRNGEQGCREYLEWFTRDWASDDPKRPINWVPRPG